MYKTILMSESIDKKSYNKLYYEKNREQLLIKLKQKILCGMCGKMLSNCNMKRHTVKCFNKKCIDNLKEVERLKQQIIKINDKIALLISENDNKETDHDIEYEYEYYEEEI